MLTALNFSDGTSIKMLTPDFHDVESDVADRWFVKVYCSSDGEIPALEDGPCIAELETLVAEQATRTAGLEEQFTETKTNGEKQEPTDTWEIPR